MNNPPAFPLHDDPCLEHPEWMGMTLRDYFAAAAMQALVATERNETSKIISMTAYDFADAMLKARETE